MSIKKVRKYTLAVKYFISGWPWDQAMAIAERLTDFKKVGQSEKELGD